MRRYLFVALAIALSSAVTAIVVRGQSASAPVHTSAAGSAGRYQLVINPNVRADTFLLDTETGKIWGKIVYTDLEDEPAVWKYQDRVDNHQQVLSWIEMHTPKKNQ